MSRHLISAYYVRGTTLSLRETESSNKKMDLHLRVIQSRRAEKCVANVVNAVRMTKKKKDMQDLRFRKPFQMIELMS